MSISESRIAKLEQALGTRISQLGTGPDIGDYTLAAGMIEDDGPIGHDEASIEAAAWERYEARVASGRPGGLPVDRLPDAIRAVLVELP